MNPIELESSFDYTTLRGEPETIQNKFKEIISRAPRNNEWTSFIELFQYQGFWHSPSFLEGTILAQEEFQPHPNEIILCSAPKAGTTWLKALAFSILTRSKNTLNNLEPNPLLSSTPHECVPFLEVDLFQKKQTQYPQIPLIATHLPYVSLPKSITTNSTCRIVYISRDPKDVVVSMWHFIGNIKTCKNNEESAIFPLERAVELFCEGISKNGPYWDHVLGYWKASLEQPDRVLFLKYENLKSDTKVWVKRLAEFMGFPFSSEEVIEDAIQKVVDLCSFENLSNLEVNKNAEFNLFSTVKVKNNKYFRKGEVGDWKTCLSEEDRKKIDRISEEKLKDSGLTFG
ncbi:flavonol sulfotransferase-like [Impatiens glandulifera]|uniref:flavonol sulfotransferase-like n=1 Tax=Impatiens glandulifera TaxID=253017 RepID=UPI001FB1949D|nr:flavonol sulfotransferase-like [Impatiens glandulifera]